MGVGAMARWQRGRACRWVHGGLQKEGRQEAGRQCGVMERRGRGGGCCTGTCILPLCSDTCLALTACPLHSSHPFQMQIPKQPLSPSLLLTQAEASCGGHIPPYPGADSWRSSRSSSSSELPGPSSCFSAGTLTGPWTMQGHRTAEQQVSVLPGARRLWAMRRVQGCARVLGICIGTGRGSSR